MRESAPEAAADLEADWRFLLADTAPARVVCLAGGSLSRAAASLSGSLVPLEEALRGTDCDLAVAADPDAAALLASWTSLRPGGSCYVEWHAPSAGGRRTVERRLRAAGFTDLRCYVRRPARAVAGSRSWVPIRDDFAVRFFAAAHARGGHATRVARAARLALWRLRAGSGLVRPLCVVATKPGAPRRVDDGDPTVDAAGRRPVPARAAPSAAPGALAIARAHASAVDPDIDVERVSLLLAAPGGQRINKLVGFVFDGRHPTPRFVVKLPRVRAAELALRHEATVLAWLQRSGRAIEGVPRLLFDVPYAGGSAVGLSFVDGTPLWRVLHAARHPALARMLTEWSVQLAHVHGDEAGDAAQRAGADALFDGFAARFRDATDRGLLRAGADQLTDLGPCPVTCEQRDLSPWNVMISDERRLAVLDWESAEPTGWPALDLWYGLSYLTFYREGAMRSGRIREAYRRLLDGSTSVGRIAAECLLRYGEATGLSDSQLARLRQLTWLVHARSEYDRLVEIQGRTPEPAALRRSVFLGLWEEEVRHATRA